MKYAIATTLAVGVMIIATAVAQEPTATAIDVVRGTGCACCLKWVEHLKQAGFVVTVTESSELKSFKDSKKVPAAARSCHTAMVAGYVVEGHVPATDIQRLLKERPEVLGLTLPGMPIGAPGMESPDGKVSPYDVLTFDKSGQTAIFSSHH